MQPTRSVPGFIIRSGIVAQCGQCANQQLDWQIRAPVREAQEGLTRAEFVRQHRSVLDQTSEFTIRLATVADAATVAWHRARMWQDMGEVPDDLFEPLRAKCEAQLRQTLADGAYVGWLASAPGASEVIIAGAGVHLRYVMAHPLREGSKTIAIAEGRHGTIVNVFTEPEWRWRGVAALLMARIIAWSREERLDRLVLHASSAGRALYEKMGFIATNEMSLE